MKAVLISIKPLWCERILNGEKTIEVRKTRPKIETPFKVYIYCTKGKSSYEDLWTGKNQIIGKHSDTSNGKVVGEFVCDAILPISITYSDPNHRIASREFPLTCLTDKQIIDYLGNGKEGYGWHISDIVMYDRPMELWEFAKKCNEDCENCGFWKYERVNANEFDMECTSIFYGHIPLKRPPQSWCYVKEMNNA